MSAGTGAAGAIDSTPSVKSADEIESDQFRQEKKQLKDETDQQLRQEIDVALTGKTLLVYRYLVTTGRPAGARQVQRALKLSGPSVAAFHLEKLARVGLIKKSDSEAGAYVVERVYLKHYFLLRQRLVPKYFLFASLATFSVIGWITTLFLRPSSPRNFPFTPFGGSVADFYVFIYGITLSVIFAVIFWRETFLVLGNEKI